MTTADVERALVLEFPDCEVHTVRPGLHELETFDAIPDDAAWRVSQDWFRQREARHFFEGQRAVLFAADVDLDALAGEYMIVEPSKEAETYTYVAHQGSANRPSKSYRLFPDTWDDIALTYRHRSRQHLFSGWGAVALRNPRRHEGQDLNPVLAMVEANRQNEGIGRQLVMVLNGVSKALWSKPLSMGPADNWSPSGRAMVEDLRAKELLEEDPASGELVFRAQPAAA